MPEKIRKVNVIGHQHPDTDSICAAIAYAYLKNQVDKPIYAARRAGAINRETAFVLSHFGFDEPPLITTVTPQIKDIEFDRQPGISPETSLFAAWNIMRDGKLSTLCITDEDDGILGLIAVKDIANANMDIFDNAMLGEAQTHCSNLLETLDAKILAGDPDGTITRGRVRIGTSPEMMEELVEPGDIVLVTNRYENQKFAVDSDVSCLIVCGGAQVSDKVLASAERRGCTVLTTPYDTYAAARLICMSIPVRAKMLPAEKVLRFNVNTALDEARRIMAKSQHRFFPVSNEDGSYAGLVSSPDMLNYQKKHVILVDHNERSQTIDGIEQAEIMEIIDHHRIGTLETSGPVAFRNEPVGCTCTIIYEIFQERGLDIPANIAGLMMSAILSDTLCFRSPTCTPKDKETALALAEICGEDVEKFSEEMFDAGADLTGRTADEVFNSDFKVFSRGNAHFGVGQGSFMTEQSRHAAEDLVGPYLETGARANEIPIIFYMFTDVKSQSTEMLYWGTGADEILTRAFGVECQDGKAVLDGIVSRKKQVIPAIMSTIQTLQEERE